MTQFSQRYHHVGKIGD